MLLIWRGFGIFAILIPITFLFLVQYVTALIAGDGYFQAHPILAGVTHSFSAAIVFFIGKHVNRRIPPSEDNPFGREKGDRQHSLFEIPLEFWAIPIALVAFSNLREAFF
ncbi:hypothetical protein ACO0LM_26875 [Undibacterium sp. Di26W]|uniref:hypothetical protein n=1 Tax=Undibacterium sp. Di26W TaxID=3413035 RepID=UPI003BF228DF